VAALGAPQPQRIVSTAPSITEMLYALGLGDRVAGVTTYCRYPPEARLKPKIGDYTSPNVEAIAALKPDLVILQTNPVRLAERLAALHLKTTRRILPRSTTPSGSSARPRARRPKRAG
jgi:iron complex transport system substrate-binding protein